MLRRLVYGLIALACFGGHRGALAQDSDSSAVDEHTSNRIGRATLLAVHLEDMERRSDVLPWGIGLSMAAGAAGIGAGLFVDDLPAPGGFIIGGSLALGGGIAALAGDEWWRGPLAMSSYFGGLGATLIGLGIADEDFRVPGLALGIGSSTSAALMLISTAIRPQVPLSHLARDYERLRDPKVRAALTEREVAAIEDRYRRLAPAIDPRIMFAPMLIGNGIASASYIARARTDGGRAYASLWLGIGVVLPVLLMLQPIDYELYEVELEHAGITLQVTPAPNGASVNGTF